MITRTETYARNRMNTQTVIQKTEGWEGEGNISLADFSEDGGRGGGGLFHLQILTNLRAVF